MTFVQRRIAAEAGEVAGVPMRRRGQNGAGRAGGVPYSVPERTPGADAAAAAKWLDGLVADGRYVEDVYAAC